MSEGCNALEGGIGGIGIGDIGPKPKADLDTYQGSVTRSRTFTNCTVACHTVYTLLAAALLVNHRSVRAVKAASPSSSHVAKVVSGGDGFTIQGFTDLHQHPGQFEHGI